MKIHFPPSCFCLEFTDVLVSRDWQFDRKNKSQFLLSNLNVR